MRECIVNGLVVDADKAARPKPGIPLDKAKIAELLIKHRGNLTRVAVAMGTSRTAVRTVCNANPELKHVLDEARERIVDDIEDAFLDKAIAGDTTSQIFFLKTRARDRGYDQDFRADIEGVTRTALQWALNKSRNPAEGMVTQQGYPTTTLIDIQDAHTQQLTDK